MAIELSKRLQAVADLVSPDRSVADIGCDHGYVSIYLMTNKHCKRVIAMDVKDGPLSHAKRNIEKFGLKDKIEVRLSDGTKKLNAGEVDTLLLSGMGGKLTIRIVEDGISRLGTFEELILQPQSEIHLVREFLRKNGYQIVDEDIVYEDGKFYPMMKAVLKIHVDEYPLIKSKKVYSEQVEDLFGPVLLQKRTQTFVDYLSDKQSKLIVVQNKVTQKKRKDEIEGMLSYIEEALME